MIKKNKFLTSVVLSSTILLNSFIPCFAEKNNSLVENKKIKASISTVKTHDNRNVEKNDGNVVFKWIKNHKILTGILGISAVHDFSNMILWNVNPQILKWLYKKMAFSDVKPNTYTKRQEGAMWCAIACVQGLLKHKGVEVSQKDIYKGSFGNIWFTPIFEAHRTKGGLNFYSNMDDYLNFLRDKYNMSDDETKKLDWHTKVFLKDHSLFHDKVSSYVEKATQDQYTYKVEFITLDDNYKENLKEYVMEQIKKILKKHQTFSIIDSFAYTALKQFHFVNVVGIDNSAIIPIGCSNKPIDSSVITIEDPASGYSYKRTLYGFVENLLRTIYSNGCSQNVFFRKRGITYAYLEKKEKNK